MKPVIPQTLNINNLRTTSAKSIKLHTIRKFIKHSLKNARIKVFTVTAFEILLFEDRSVLSPTQQGTGSKRVKVIPHKFRIYFHKRFKNFQSQILEVSLMRHYCRVEEVFRMIYYIHITFIILLKSPMMNFTDPINVFPAKIHIKGE